MAGRKKVTPRRKATPKTKTGGKQYQTRPTIRKPR